MSLESSFKSIAESMAVIAAAVEKMANPKNEDSDTPLRDDPTDDMPAPANATPDPTQDKMPAPADYAGAPELTVTMTVDEVNTALVAENERLGATTDSFKKILDLMRGFGANSVHDMQPDQYAALLKSVKELT